MKEQSSISRCNSCCVICLTKALDFGTCGYVAQPDHSFDTPATWRMTIAYRHCRLNGLLLHACWLLIKPNDRQAKLQGLNGPALLLPAFRLVLWELHMSTHVCDVSHHREPKRLMSATYNQLTKSWKQLKKPLLPSSVGSESPWPCASYEKTAIPAFTSSGKTATV